MQISSSLPASLSLCLSSPFCLFAPFCHVAVSSLGVCSVSRMTFGTDGWLTVQPQTIAGREVELEWPGCDWHASKMPVDTGTRGWNSCLSVFGNVGGQIASFCRCLKVAFHEFEVWYIIKHEWDLKKLTILSFLIRLLNSVFCFYVFI